jgi:hypothetical protein
VWAGLSAGAALLAIAGSVVGLLVAGPIYRRETSALSNAAAAQDLVNLVLVSPLLLVLAVRAYRGSLRSWMCWLGCLAFTVYNYAIYAFSIHFGPLFPVWIMVLGLSMFALIGGLTALDPSALDGAVRRQTGAPAGMVPHRRGGVVRAPMAQRDRARPARQAAACQRRRVEHPDQPGSRS